eukprot:TRINITY_DN23971_c0_g1_i1.p1 TRINITY_DN23971_c0_g1~~TRINITY_DN23971_c0_g1_i1.p1  ORF type:complete len:384 (+),score=137.45 TRINITY_DN23971_c0_g1_i1:82-1152(+)
MRIGRAVQRLARSRAGRTLGVGVVSGALWGGAQGRSPAHAFFSFGSPKMQAEVLKRQDAVTSETVIAILGSDDGFARLARREAAEIIARDREDDAKLARGVEFSISRGVLPRIDPPPVRRIDVKGKTPDQVADIILGDVRGAGGKGSVVVLQGMSGTGKGTTAAKLMSALPSSAAWSNGNVFRSLTLLAVTEFGDRVTQDTDAVMTPANVARWMGMLSFHKVGPGKYDIRIRGNGHDVLVSEVQNTTLKQGSVGRAIPSVAQYTQGDVVQFASRALQQMAADGMNVILEGRGPTVQYVPTPHRYELVLSDEALLGQRRAAQRTMARALQTLGDDAAGDVTAAVTAACAAIVKEEKI